MFNDRFTRVLVIFNSKKKKRYCSIESYFMIIFCFPRYYLFSPSFRAILIPLKYFINLVRVHRNLSFTYITACPKNRLGYVVKQQSQNPTLMVFSEFTSEASLFKRGPCNERRNEKQLRLLSRDRAQRLSTLNAHGRTCGAAPLRGSRERR